MDAPSRWRKHVPFALFVVVLFGVAYWMDQNLALLLPALHAARILIQLALAATVIAVLHHVVGIKSFGTFAPVIVAFSIIYTGLILGLLLFGIVLAILIVTRWALQGQRIQQSHRAAIMVLMVAFTGTLVAAYASAVGQPELSFVLLFPVVITAWVADFYLVKVAKVGWGAPTKALAWTLILVAAAYVVIVQDWLVDLVMRQPLSWPLLVLVNWALGTRVEFRVSDRLRFGAMKRLEDVLLAGGIAKSILTITRRNRAYVDRYNPPEVMGVLNKARAKALLLGEGIPVPENYALVARSADLEDAVEIMLQAEDFVVKPADGYGGEGIVVVHERKEDRYVTSEGLLTSGDLLTHLRSILEGEYNHGEPDEALVEARVETHDALRAIAPQGVPDIRVLCLLGHPVMAMLRLPTLESGGKANLHQGAVGAGIELHSGKISLATWKGAIVRRHPDTGKWLHLFRVPYWEAVLRIAAEAQRVSGLGFAGVDVVLDAERGPLVLEVNRRPGLEIQKANGTGLRARLEAIEALPLREEPVEVRVLRAMEMDRLGWKGLPGSPGSRPEGEPSEIVVAPPEGGSGP